MNEKLNFTLPEERKERSGNGIWRILITLLVLVILVLQVYILKNPVSEKKTGSIINKDLAVQFENRNLYSNAFNVWKEYLDANPGLNKKEKAKIYYRMANLLMKNSEFEKAIKYYFYSEKTEKIDELRNDINKNILECYRRMGNITGVSVELASRSSLTPEEEEKKNSEVIVEIGSKKFTKADLTKRIEEIVDLQIKQMMQYQPSMTDADIAKQKEEILNRIDDKQKTQILMQWLQNEVLYLEAVERGLNTLPENEKAIDNYRKSYLAQQVISDEKKKIKLSESDLTDYFAAHKSDYVSPEKVKIGMIKCGSKADIEKVFDKIKNGTDFESAAKEFSTDKTTAEKGGKIESWIEKGKYIPGIGTNNDVHAHIFAMKKDEVSDEPVKVGKDFYIFKVYDHKEQRMPEFDDVRDKVMQDKRSKKEQELMKDYSDKLMKKYNVIIHQGKINEITKENKDYKK